MRRLMLHLIALGVVLLSNKLVQSFSYYRESRGDNSSHCSSKLHCHHAAAKVFKILATHEGIVEPSIYVTVSKGSPTMIYASFPTEEAKTLRQHSRDLQINLIFRRRADSYGRFFDDLSLGSSLKYNFSFVTVLRDDCTLRSATSEALYRAGTFFGSFSHRGPIDPDRVLSIPDHRFIDTHGFSTLMKKLNNVTRPFAEKIPTLFWRGSSTGSKVACLDILRVKIALKLKNDQNANFKISRPKVCHLNGTTLDFAEVGIFGDYAAEEDWVGHRAIMEVDGNFATNGLPWRVLSGSVLFRVISDNFGWIEPLLRPHEHYIPVREDLSDLPEATRLAATTNSSELAMLQKIATNGKSLSDRLSYDSVLHHFALDVNRFVEMRG